MEVKDEDMILNKEGVQITKSRAILGSKTYAVANITSVQLDQKKSSCATVGILFFGLLLALWGIVSRTETGPNWVVIIIGVVIFAVGIASDRAIKPTYMLKIASSSGEQNVMESEDKVAIQEIVDALNTAIATRG